MAERREEQVVRGRARVSQAIKNWSRLDVHVEARAGEHPGAVQAVEALRDRRQVSADGTDVHGRASQSVAVGFQQGQRPEGEVRVVDVRPAQPSCKAAVGHLPGPDEVDAGAAETRAQELRTGGQTFVELIQVVVLHVHRTMRTMKRRRSWRPGSRVWSASALARPRSLSTSLRALSKTPASS